MFAWNTLDKVSIIILFLSFIIIIVFWIDTEC